MSELESALAALAKDRTTAQSFYQALLVEPILCVIAGDQPITAVAVAEGAPVKPLIVERGGTKALPIFSSESEFIRWHEAADAGIGAVSHATLKGDGFFAAVDKRLEVVINPGGAISKTLSGHELRELKRVLRRQQMPVRTGDGGGFAPVQSLPEQVLTQLTSAMAPHDGVDCLHLLKPAPSKSKPMPDYLILLGGSSESFVEAAPRVIQIFADVLHAGARIEIGRLEDEGQFAEAIRKHKVAPLIDRTEKTDSGQ